MWYRAGVETGQELGFEVCVYICEVNVAKVDLLTGLGRASMLC